jgi:hypothetical protein
VTATAAAKAGNEVEEEGVRSFERTVFESGTVAGASAK